MTDTELVTTLRREADFLVLGAGLEVKSGIPPTNREGAARELAALMRMAADALTRLYQERDEWKANATMLHTEKWDVLSARIHELDERNRVLEGRMLQVIDDWLLVARRLGGVGQIAVLEAMRKQIAALGRVGVKAELESAQQGLRDVVKGLREPPV